MSLVRQLFYVAWMMIGLIILARYYANFYSGQPFLAWTFDGTSHAVYLVGRW